MRENWLHKLDSRPFLRNFSLLTVGNFGSRIISMVINIIVARFLAPERYGEYSLVLTYISMFYFVASLGLSQLVTRSVAREQDHSAFYFRLSLVLRGGGFIVSAVAFALYAFFTHQEFSSFVIFSILGGVFLESLWDAEQNVAFGMQRMEWNTVIGISATLLNLVIYLLMPRSWFTVESVLAVYLGVYVLKTVAYYVCLKHFSLLRGDGGQKHISFQESQDYLKQAMPFYLMYLLSLFTGQFPILFLEHNTGVVEVAYFNTANKLLLPITLFMQTAFSAFFPNQSILFARDRAAFSMQTRKVLALVCGLGVYMAISASLFKGELVALLYGADYANTANVLAYQCWYTVLYGIFCLNGNTLGAADAQGKLAVCSVIYALVSTPILYFSSRRGAEGLAAGFVLASILNLLYIFPVLKKTVGGAMTWKFSGLLLAVVFASIAFSLFAIDALSLPWRIALFFALSMGIFAGRKTFVKVWKE